MATRIKRETIFLEVVAQTNSKAFGEGQCAAFFKENGDWFSSRTDCPSFYWRERIGHLRDPKLYEVRAQYSMVDIVYYLMKRNPDYQTVCWDFLVEAVEEALQEAQLECVDDIYTYVSTHLI